ARLHRQILKFSLTTHFTLNDRNEVQQIFTPRVANVKHAGGRLVTFSRWRSVQAGQNTTDDIVNKGEVAFHTAAIEHRELRSLRYRFCEYEQGHVRSSPRTVNREESQTCLLDAVEVAVAVAHQLV